MSALLESFRTLAETLPGAPPPAELPAELTALEERLTSMRACYSSRPPEGAEDLYAGMLEALDAYLEATAQVVAYLEDGEPSRLDRAAEQAQLAEDIFAEAEYAIGESQAWLGEHQQG